MSSSQGPPPPLTKANLAASYLNMLLCTLELYLFAKAMIRKRKGFTRYLAVAMIVNSILSTLMSMGVVITTSVYASKTSPWPLAVAMLTQGLAGFGEHAYLIVRYYKMSKNLPLTIFLVIVTVAHVGCHAGAASYLVSHKVPLFQRKSKVGLSRAAFALSSAVDVMVAIGIVWQLRQFEVVFRASKNFMYKLVVLSVISGSLTAATGIIFIILLSTSKYGHLIVAFNAVKLYGITVFTNLAITEGTRPRSMFIGETKMSGVYRLSGMKSSAAPPSGSGPKSDDSPSQPGTTVAQGSSREYSISHGNI